MASYCLIGFANAYLTSLLALFQCFCDRFIFSTNFCFDVIGRSFAHARNTCILKHYGANYLYPTVQQNRTLLTH